MIYPETRRAYRRALKALRSGTATAKATLTDKQAEELLTDAAIADMEQFRIDTGGGSGRQEPLIYLINRRVQQGRLPLSARVDIRKLPKLSKKALERKVKKYNKDIEKYGLQFVRPIDIDAIVNKGKLARSTYGFNALAAERRRETVFYDNLSYVFDSLENNMELQKLDPTGELLKQFRNKMSKGKGPIAELLKGKFLPNFETMNYDTSSTLSYLPLRDFGMAFGIDFSKLPRPLRNKMGMP